MVWSTWVGLGAVNGPGTIQIPKDMEFTNDQVSKSDRPRPLVQLQFAILVAISLFFFFNEKKKLEFRLDEDPEFQGFQERK